ncbi:MAG: hypothetical protein ACD_74C00141G0004 [uncultured bacterium]|nr:MAG: hypothetical protein ACD_74C00141G0004 [uncultured bacterium]
MRAATFSSSPSFIRAMVSKDCSSRVTSCFMRLSSWLSSSVVVIVSSSFSSFSFPSRMLKVSTRARNGLTTSRASITAVNREMGRKKRKSSKTCRMIRSIPRVYWAWLKTI